jgi:hypothetical protein
MGLCTARAFAFAAAARDAMISTVSIMCRSWASSVNVGLMLRSAAWFVKPALTLRSAP